jgi:MFS transporter, ACS family, glucarate transporter
MGRHEAPARADHRHRRVLDDAWDGTRPHQRRRPLAGRRRPQRAVGRSGAHAAHDQVHGMTRTGMGVDGPTRVRRTVLGFLMALAFLTYLDRACMAYIKPYLMDDFHLTMDEMSVIFSSFALAYGIFEIPTGHWGDRIGPRLVLTRIVAWWSSFTIAGGLAVGYGSMVAIRFLFGMGEAGAWPNSALAMSRWIPVAEQGTAQGTFFAMAHLGGAITPFIVGWMLLVVNWRMVLFAFGALGFCWVVAWHRWFRDDPATHPGVNAAELSIIRAGQVRRTAELSLGGLWRSAATSRPLLLLCLVYATNGYGFYFLITWLPDYLRSFKHFSAFELQFYSGLPLFLSVFADLTGGRLTDRLTARFGMRTGRALVGGVGYLLAGIAVIISTWCRDPVASAILFSLGAAFSMFTLGATWSALMAISGRYTGTIGAVMNSASQVGSVLSPIVLSWVVGRFDDWKIPIYIIGSLYFVAAVAWLFLDSAREIFPRGIDPPAGEATPDLADRKR